MNTSIDSEKIIVIDFGGQYTQLVARRVRECNVYCEIYSYRTPLDEIRAMKPKGIILTGGPNSCYEEGAPSCTPELFELRVPVLGLCYGAQLMQHVLGGEVKRADNREYGRTEVYLDPASPLFRNLQNTKTGETIPAESTSGFLSTNCWMSHFDYISKVADGFRTIAHTDNCPYAAVENTEKNLYPI